MRVDEVVENKEVRKLVSYLGAFKVIEGDLGLFDELSRVKDLRSFANVINKFLRVKDRVIKKLIEGANKDYEIKVLSEAEVNEENIRKLFDIGSESIKEIFKLAEKDPHFIATIISSLALAYSGIKSKKRGGS